MIILLSTQAELDEAIARLVRCEPAFSPLVQNNCKVRLRHTKPGLGSLVQLMTQQMISLKAAQHIWNRLEAVGPEITPAGLYSLEDEQLRDIGLSAAKTRAVKALAKTCREDPQFFDKLHLADDDDVRSRLTALTGIGPWTAELYLLQALARADAWPGGDIALQHAAMSVFDLPKKPDTRLMESLAANWRPWRSAAACLLWQHYRNLRTGPASPHP